MDSILSKYHVEIETGYTNFVKNAATLQNSVGFFTFSCRHTYIETVIPPSWNIQDFDLSYMIKISEAKCATVEPELTLSYENPIELPYSGTSESSSSINLQYLF